jgi:PAS domain S-box-containing protein
VKIERQIEKIDDIQRAVLDALGEGLVVQDASGGIVYANPAAERILGVDAGEMLGLTSKDQRWVAVNVDGEPLLGDEHPIVSARLTGRSVRGVVMAVERPNGEQRWLEVSAVPLIDDTDAPPVGAVAVFSDVTDELAAKVALKQSEERFRTAVETMLDGFMIWRTVRDENGRVVDFVCEFANAAVAGFGYRAEELVGRRMLDLSPRLDDRYFSHYAAVAESGEPLRLQVPWYEGTKVRGAFDVSAVRMGDGVAMTFRDVTEQLEHEHALRESEEQTRRFLEAIPIGVAVIELGNLVFANEAFRQLLGDLDTDVRGPALVEHFDLRRADTGEPYPFDELPLARAFFAGVATSADDIVIMRDGVPIPVEGYAAPVRDSAGEVRFALTILRDITARRRHEQRLTDSLAELASTNEELAEFAGIAAHDLASPLRAIAGFATLLEETYADALDPRGSEWIGYVLAESDRMRAFIEDLLAYSRAGADGGVEARIDLGDVARAARDALRPEIEEAGATVEVGALPEVVGDGSRLGQVFHNLVANAIKFRAPERAVVIAIAAERAGAEWVVSVTDNGVGVPQAERLRVFAPFRRGADADVPGHGLGLSICRRIVERHAGRIWVEEGNGCGSRFCFSLPVAPSAH